MPDLAAGAPVNSACACMLSSPYVSGTIVRFEPVKLPHAGLTALSRAVLPALCPLSSSQVERFSSRRSIEWQSAFVANIVSATVRSVRLSHLRDCYPFSIPHVMGYQEGPWTFRGRALYQLNLVPVEEAKKHIPSDFQIVSCFGYTLGGFYLARYADSPVGKFDELVALAGLVWNAPTSCAWAARVYVSNREARTHGRKHCGLPSHYAAFEERAAAPSTKGRSSWWRQGDPASEHQSAGPVVLCTEERRSWRQPWRKPVSGQSRPVCSMALPAARRARWSGPRIKMTLPSFSGATAECPDLLHYACQLCTNVRVVRAAHVQVGESEGGESQEPLSAILGGKPVIALAFDNMKMVVNEPQKLQLQTGSRHMQQLLA